MRPVQLSGNLRDTTSQNNATSLINHTGCSGHIPQIYPTHRIMLLFYRTVIMPDVSAADLEMLTRMVYFSSEARIARVTPAELRRIRGVAAVLRFDIRIFT